jgi:transposase InsO family protein
VPEKAVCPKKQGRVSRALSRLHRLEDAGRCQVFYGDESGFCLSPPLPYLWQPKGKTLGLPAKAHSRRLSVFGLLSRQGCLHHFRTQETVTAEFVIESVETLLPALPCPTMLVLDNATVHRSKSVQAKRKEWKQKGLRLLFLPPYCPHLNLIEILWRQVKYHWLGSEAYADFKTLCQSVTDVLAEVGTKYQISFA